MQGKTGISDIHPSPNLNSDKLYSIFAHDLPTSEIAELSDVSRPTINHCYSDYESESPSFMTPHRPFSGEVEVDESCFGARRVRGEKGRGAGGKAIVFGILERYGKDYTEIVPNVAKKPYRPQSRARWPLEHHPLGRLRGYDGLVDRGYKKHLHMNHGQHEFARGNCPINGIESLLVIWQREIYSEITLILLGENPL